MKPEVVVITGASAGVGRATAREFARRKALIGIVARGEEGIEATKRDIEALGGEALSFAADVADAERVEWIASETEKRFGPIDMWVNNAMETVISPFLEMSPEEFRRVTEVTYLGYVHGTMAALRRMVPRDRGVIVQVGSALSYRSIPYQSAYCGAKHAIRGFTDSIRSELLHQGSRVKLSMVQMPAVNTPQFTWSKSRLPHKPQPVPPIYQPEIPARAVFWIAHHPRREMFVGISSVLTIWLNKFFPSVGDWYLAKTGWSSQQYDGMAEKQRPDNLWSPVDHDFGAHGEFDMRSSRNSPELWMTTHRGLIAFAAAAAGGMAVALQHAARKKRLHSLSR